MTHFAQGWPPAQADSAAGLGLGGVRDELYWSEVEKSPGVYTFSATFDGYMAKLRQDGLAPLIELDFENPLYDGGQTPYTAAGLAAYANYGAAVLNHYGAQISAVEIWNEYNGGFCTGPAASSREATYTAMLKQAYARIKGLRPDVTVVGGSTAGTPLPYWEKLMQGGALGYLDALSIHPYRYESPPEGIEHEIAALQAMVLKYNHGVAKPIWVTEIGWQEQTAPLLIDGPTLAKYVTRSYALLLSTGVQKIYWYLLHDDSNQPMGLYQADLTAKPAAQAMRTITGELTGAAFVKTENTPANVYSLLFQTANGRQVRVMWALADRLVTLGGVTRAVDLLGNSLGLAGSYVLSDSPIFVEGYVSGVPAPSATDEVLLADSAADFAGTQGANGWSYGSVDGTGAFTAMPTYTADEWNYFWTANHSYLSITAVDQHPSVDGTKPVKAVRRWTSSLTGSVHLTGDFQGVPQGDGVGVAILVDGHPALARQIIGGPNPAAENFDLVQSVSQGTTIDFAVDPGPGTNMNYDATAFAARILARPPAVAPGTVLADSVRDFSGTQGANGWTYGDFPTEKSSAFEPATAFAAGAWSGKYASLAVTATTQHPALGTNGLDEVVAVRRWTSSYTGNVHFAGSFVHSRAGDGVGVAVLLNGSPLVARSQIGVSGPSVTKAFDLVAAVKRGDVIDFTVDPGPCRDIGSDNPGVTAIISVP